MSLLAVPIIAVVAVVVSILCLVIVVILSIRHKAQIKMLASQCQSQELILNNLQKLNEKLHANINELHERFDQITTENIQVSKQLEHRIKTLQSLIDNQQEGIVQLQTDQGHNKFYTRAIKLAKKGADIDEIVTECELPHAEVEMLISVYQKKTSL